MTEPIHIPSLTDSELDEVLLGVNNHSRIVRTMALVEVTRRATKPLKARIVEMEEEAHDRGMEAREEYPDSR